ncbi:MAG: RNA polymerase sigma factor [bacterium]
MDSSKGKSMPDAELLWINDFKSGNKNAFEHIINRYKSPLINFCYRYLGSKDEAEDAAQDILVKIYNALDRFVPTSKFSTWMFAIASNHCKNLLRKKKLLSFFSLDDLWPDDTASHTHELDTSSLQTEVHNALLQLPDKQKTVIILSKFENLSHDEIAEILNVSRGAVKQLIFRAKTTLYKSLKKHIP